MLLDHCYEFGLLPPPHPPGPMTYFASPWIRPWADMAKTS